MLRNFTLWKESCQICIEMLPFENLNRLPWCNRERILKITIEGDLSEFLETTGFNVTNRIRLRYSKSLSQKLGCRRRIIMEIEWMDGQRGSGHAILLFKVSLKIAFA